MVEKFLIDILKKEEELKYSFLNIEEVREYTRPLTVDELVELDIDVKENLKKFNLTVDTLKAVGETKIRTKRLTTRMSDDEYDEFIKKNVYNVKKTNETELARVIKDWIENFKVIGENLHLCFDTESCETKESYDCVMEIVNEHFPGYDINNPDERLGEFIKYLDNIELIRSVRVYSWSLGCVGSTTQIHGETLEEFNNLIELIFTIVKDKSLRSKKSIYAYTKNILIDVHNLAWDLEFLKYFWLGNNVKHWHKKTVKDNKKTVIMLSKNNGTITSIEKTAYMELREQQPGNTFNVVIGKGQTYECKWQLEDTKITKVKKGNDVEYTLRRNVHFYDMAKKIALKLEQVANNIIIDNHFKKADNYDYSKIRDIGEFLTNDEVQYQYNDVYIMCKYLEQVYYGRKLQGTTASGIAFNSMLDFKYPGEKDKYTCFLEHYPTMLHNTDNWHIRKFYRDMYDGGFTMGVKQLEGKLIDGIIIGLDINSAYPHQMRNGKLPYGKPFHGLGKANKEKLLEKGYDIFFQRVKFDGFERKGKGIEKDGEGYGFIQLGNSNESDRIIKRGNKFTLDGYCYTKRERPCTNLKNNGDTILEDFECYWTEDTLNFMLETHNFWHYKREIELDDNNFQDTENDIDEFVYNEKIEGLFYVDYVAFKSEVGYFGEFIDNYIREKQIGKILNNDGLSFVAKMCMNSCSGKMGSTFVRENTDIVRRKSGLLGYNKPLEDREYFVNREYFVPYIAFITDYTRLKLMEIIYKVESKFGFKNFPFQGCDTDSLYLKIPYTKDLNTVGKMVEYIKSLGIEIDSIKLGAWDIEKIIFKYKNLGSKKMMMDHIEFKDCDLNKDCMEYLEEYKNGKIKYKTKVTCAGLPDNTREEIAKKGFNYFSKNIEYRKLIKEKCYGGYMLNWGTHKIKDSLFN